MLSNCGAGEDSWESLDSKEIKPVILKAINPDYSLEEQMLKLKLQYFGCLLQRTDSLEQTLMLGKLECRRRREWQRIRWVDGIVDSVDMNLSKLWEIVKDREACCSPWGHKQLDTTRDWTTEETWTLAWFFPYTYLFFKIGCSCFTILC